MLHLIFIFSLIFSLETGFNKDTISKFINNKICYQNEIKFIACYFSINSLLSLENYYLIPKKNIINNFYNVVFFNISGADNFSLVNKIKDDSYNLDNILKQIIKLFTKYKKNNKKLDIPIDFNNILSAHLMYIENIENNLEVISKILEIEDIQSLEIYLNNLNINFNTYISIKIVNEFLKILHPYNKLSIEAIEIQDYYTYKPGFEVLYDETIKRLIVSKVYENSDAFYKGVKEGMYIVSINNCLLFDEYLFDTYIQGLINTKVNFKFNNPQLTTDIMFDKEVFAINNKFLNQINKKSDEFLKLSNTQKNIFSIYDEPFLYIKINYFSGDNSNNFIKNLNQVNNDINKFKPKQIILDLRNSVGGALLYAKKFLELFFERKTLLFTQNVLLDEDYLINVQDIRRGRIEVFSDLEGEINIPVSILTNDLTASSSELVAGVFKELRNSYIIGSSYSTYGKSVSSTMFEYEGVFLNNIISELLLPVSNSSFDYIGIKSDIYINNLYYNPSCLGVKRMQDIDFIFKYRNLNINFKKEARNIKTYNYRLPYRLNNKIIYDYQYYFARTYFLNSFNK